MESGTVGSVFMDSELYFCSLLPEQNYIHNKWTKSAPTKQINISIIFQCVELPMRSPSNQLDLDQKLPKGTQWLCHHLLIATAYISLLWKNGIYFFGVGMG